MALDIQSNDYLKLPSGTTADRPIAIYRTPGTYTWVAPAGVNSVLVWVVGGGGGIIFEGVTYPVCVGRGTNKPMADEITVQAFKRHIKSITQRIDKNVEIINSLKSSVPEHEDILRTAVIINWYNNASEKLMSVSDECAIAYCISTYYSKINNIVEHDKYEALADRTRLFISDAYTFFVSRYATFLEHYNRMSAILNKYNDEHVEDSRLQKKGGISVPKRLVYENNYNFIKLAESVELTRKSLDDGKLRFMQVLKH